MAALTPTYSTNLSYRTLLQFLPIRPSFKNFLWIGDLIYQAATFTDVGDYIGMSANQLALGSDMGAMAINTLARTALFSLALYMMTSGPRILLPERPARPALPEDPFKSGAVGLIPALKTPLGRTYEQEAVDVWGSEVARFDPKDRRGRVQFLVGSHDWNGALSPNKSWTLQSFVRKLSNYFDVKFEAVDDPLQICEKVRKAGKKKNRMVATIMHFHGGEGFVRLGEEAYWKTDSLAYKPTGCGIKWKSIPKEFLPYCFKDNSENSKLVMMSCNGATAPLDDTGSFAEYLYNNTGKTVVSADGLLAGSFFTPENGDSEFLLTDMNGKDLTTVYEKEGFYKPRPDLVPQPKTNILLQSIGYLGMAWRTARWVASGAILAGKVCGYAANKINLTDRNSVLVSTLKMESEWLSAFGEKVHSRLDLIQDTVKKNLRPSLWGNRCRRLARYCLKKTGAFQLEKKFADRHRSISVECQAAHDETLEKASMNITTKNGSIVFYHHEDKGWKLVSKRNDGGVEDFWYFDRNVKNLEKKFLEQIDQHIIAPNDPLLDQARRCLFGALRRCWLEEKTRACSNLVAILHSGHEEEERIMVQTSTDKNMKLKNAHVQIFREKGSHEFNYEASLKSWRCYSHVKGAREEELMIPCKSAAGSKQKIWEKIDPRVIALNDPKLNKALHCLFDALKDFS